MSIVQPLIEPLFDGRSAIEVLSMIVGDEKHDGGGYDIVRRTVQSLVDKPFTEWSWKKLLADGVIEGTAVEATGSREPGGGRKSNQRT